MQRRKFLELGSLGLSALTFSGFTKKSAVNHPVVLSTWDTGINANKAAWEVLRKNGHALDAVEQGVMVTENEKNCCVGIAAYPDRDGYVTLDASIMDHQYNCGSVAFLQRIKHPISVARKVMENTPHVLLVGEGAQQFALSQGFMLEENKLSDDAKQAYDEWLKKSKYEPVINIENSKQHGAFAPSRFENGAWNHDTIGMIAMDANGDLSGSCTTSGMAFKMHGRVGDSPIIGAGLFVDNEVGAATATGQGEDVIRIAGSHTVVELMRQGYHPEQACKMAVQRIIKAKGLVKAKQIQIGFIAIKKNGEYGGFAMQKGFNYAVCISDNSNRLVDAKFLVE